MARRTPCSIPLGRLPRERAIPWNEWLAAGTAAQTLGAIRQATRTGRPLGSQAFVAEMERRSKRLLGPQKRGPQAKAQDKHRKTPDSFGGV